MSTKTIQLTEKHSITLGEITRTHLVKAMQEDGETRYAHLKPKPVESYSHELAYQNIGTYKAEWDAYQAAITNIYPFTMLGVAWQVGGLDQTEEEFEAEREAAIAVGRRLGLATPSKSNVVEMGALVYALIELRAGEETGKEVAAWLAKAAGLLNDAVVAEERKSAEGNGEQPAPGGSERGDKKPRKGRG